MIDMSSVRRDICFVVIDFLRKHEIFGDFFLTCLDWLFVHCTNRCVSVRRIGKEILEI